MSDPLSEIAAAAAAAEEAPDLRPEKPDANRADLDSYILPPDCPVTPLGHLKGKLYLLDVDGQLMEEDVKLPKERIVYLFRRKLAWLEQNKNLCAWKNIGGNTDKNPPHFVPDGFDQRKVQIALTTACGDKGFLDIANKVRGRGSHRDRHGQLLLHCGDEILIGGRKGVRGRSKASEWHAPGLIGEHIFPTAPCLPHPAERPAPAEGGRAVLALFALWNWDSTARVTIEGRTVAIEAIIMLGWLGCAKLCGAINWRPHVWLIGNSGAGKSTLQALISRLLAEWALESQDPSEAWISQSLMDQRLAVLYDEPEPSEGEDSSGFARKIIKLARLASQGSKKGRGSSDHKPAQFEIWSCFLFSSIMHHELEQQDRNRMAVLRLSKFPPNTAALTVDGIEALLKPRFGIKGTLGELGLALTRRLVEQWDRYPETLAVYQAELMRRRVETRGQNTYGELLAMADVLLFDEPPRDIPDIGDPNPPTEADDRARRMVDAIMPLISIAATESEDLGERCIGRLTQYRLTAAAGQHQETVGRWITKALVALMVGPDASREAAAKLKTHGLKLVHLSGVDGDTIGTMDAKSDPDDKPVYLAVCGKNSEAMRQIFHGTTWRGGEWHQALSMVPGAIQKPAKLRFEGPPQLARLIPIGEVIDVAAAREEAQRKISEIMATRV